MERPSKIIWLVIAILGIFLIIGLVYLWQIQRKKPQPVTSPTGLIEEKAEALAENVLSPILSTKEDEIFYFNKSKQILERFELKNKKTSPISLTRFENASEVIWSPDKDKVIITTAKQKTRSEYEKKIYLVNLSDKKVSPLASSNLENIIWVPDGQKIAYTHSIDENRIFVSIANPDGQGSQDIVEVRTAGALVILGWPKDNKIALLKTPVFNPEQINQPPEDKEAIFYQIDIASKTIQKTDHQNVADFRYSPNGQYLVLQKEDTAGGLNVINEGDHKINLFIDSLASTNWSGDSQSFYTIVQNPDQTSEKPLILYKVKMADLGIEKVQEFSLADKKEQVYFTENLIINSQEDRIFFVRQGTLYSDKIK